MFGWTLKFEIGETLDPKDYPEDADWLIEKTIEDHMEALLFDGTNYYRHAGGGRGFMWTQKLQPMDVPEDAIAFLRLLKMLKINLEQFEDFIEVE